MNELAKGGGGGGGGQLTRGLWDCVLIRYQGTE